MQPGTSLQIHRYFTKWILQSPSDLFVPFVALFILSQLRPTVIEQSRVIGGTWVYSPNTGDDEHGLPRSDS